MFRSNLLTRYINRFVRDKRGATAVVFVIALPVFIGGIAMTVEVGHWQQNKAKLQNAADMAAIAGARELAFTQSGGAIKLASFGEAYENEFDPSAGKITVHSPPISGKYAGEDGVEVILEQDQNRYFTGLFASNAVQLRASAVALRATGEPICVLALEPVMGASIKVGGTASVDINDCAAHANSNDPNAFDVGGSGTLKAACTYSSGGYSGAAKITVTSCDQPLADRNQVLDPYAHIDVPSGVSALPCQTEVMTGKWSMFLPVDAATKVGRYCSDVSFVDLIELEDGGTYIFDGADLELKSQFAELNGKNVTLIFMNGGTYKNAKGGMTNLTAKTSGVYAGILFYSDRNTSDPTQQITFNGNAGAILEGVIYFPEQPVLFSGSTALASDCTHVIARAVSFGGNSALTNTGCEALGIRNIGGTTSVALYQ